MSFEKTLALILFVVAISGRQVFAQTLPYIDTTLPNHVKLIRNGYNKVYLWNDSVYFIIGPCKNNYWKAGSEKIIPGLSPGTEAEISHPAIRIRGNIQYDYIYRSFVDTPFTQSDFSQHSLQASLDFVIKDAYPVHVTLLTRRSNSPYFNNITDVNVQFNRQSFLQTVKDGLRKQLPSLPSNEKLNELENRYKQKQREVGDLQKWINDPVRIEEIVNEKERQAADNLKRNAESQLPDKQAVEKKVEGLAGELAAKAKDSLSGGADSLVAGKKAKPDSLEEKSFLSEFERKKKDLEKAWQDLQSQEQKLKKEKQAFQDSIDKIKRELAEIRDPAQLKAYVQQKKLDAKSLPRGWGALSSIEKIGIGRNWIDYSELTVKNVSLSGINTEICPPGFYFAFAAGKVNYRFRDFIIKNSKVPAQSLYLLRGGIGRKEKNNFILTWYSGKKSLLTQYGSSFVDSKLEKLMGVSAESRLQIDENNYLVLEAAKSTFHNAGNISNDKASARQLWNFSDHSNEAYSIKFNSYLPGILLRITGYYRRMGDHFQSFNLQPVNVNQEAYQLKLQQPFWKRRLLVDASIRKNDFSNPFINPGLTSKTIFKSLQASLRIPKYPFISVGYYPSSQLTMLDNNILVENQYNTLSAIMSYAYRFRNLGMTTNATYLKFYNNGADTGFIYYNASSWSVNQYVFLKNCQLETGLTFTQQHFLNVLTLEQSLSYQLSQSLSVSGGLRYNHVNKAEELWGGTAGVQIRFGTLGTVQLNYDKSFLPGTSRNLLPVQIGRVGYYKTF